LQRFLLVSVANEMTFSEGKEPLELVWLEQGLVLAVVGEVALVGEVAVEIADSLLGHANTSLLHADH
jgi:hypothetical protein